MQGSPQLSQAGQVFRRVESPHNNPVPTTPTEVDPDQEERRDNFRDCLCRHTMPVDSSRAPDEGDAGRLSISTRKAFLLLPRGISFQLTCFTPRWVDWKLPHGGGIQGRDGDPAGQHLGRAVLCRGPVRGPLA